MDYQPTPQPANPPMSQPQPMNPPMMQPQPASPPIQPIQPMAQAAAPRSSHAVWYIVALIIIVAGAALAYWYLYGMGTPSADTLPPTVGQTEVAPPVADNTTSAISDALSQIPNSTAALDQDAAVSAQAVQGF